MIPHSSSSISTSSYCRLSAKLKFSKHPELRGKHLKHQLIRIKLRGRNYSMVNDDNDDDHHHQQKERTFPWKLITLAAEKFSSSQFLLCGLIFIKND
jgi:hypothetical protein